MMAESIIIEIIEDMIIDDYWLISDIIDIVIWSNDDLKPNIIGIIVDNDLLYY